MSGMQSPLLTSFSPLPKQSSEFPMKHNFSFMFCYLNLLDYEKRKNYFNQTNHILCNHRMTYILVPYHQFSFHTIQLLTKPLLFSDSSVFSYDKIAMCYALSLHNMLHMHFKFNQMVLVFRIFTNTVMQFLHKYARFFLYFSQKKHTNT